MIHTGGQTGPRWRASRSESRLQRFPFFAISLFVSLLRSFHFLTSRLEGNEGGGGGRDPSLVLPPFTREGGRARPLPNFPRTPFSSRVPRRNMDFGRDSNNGKLEDLVRLALKRLNVSYLTILSRLVWYERETFVCHERGWREKRFL